MIFYDSSNNLIAGNHFDTQGGALLLFVGGTEFSVVNFAGGNNTVWGNTFETVGTPASPIALEPGYFSVGVQVAEPNDLIYNNYFDTPTTAWTIPLNLYTGYPEYFGATTTWNITQQPATNVNFAPGFPTFPLTGSIAGTAYQGGNAWWDYGLALNAYNGADNPYGVIYEERAPTLLVDVYGPYLLLRDVHLPRRRQCPAERVEHVLQRDGLGDGPAGRSGLDRRPVPGSVGFRSPVVRRQQLLGQPPERQLPPCDRRTDRLGRHRRPPATVTVSGATVTVSLTFAMQKGFHKLTFREAGLPSGTPWSVTINGTSPSDWDLNATESSISSTIVFAVLKGAGLNYTVGHVSGFVPKVGSGLVKGLAVKVKFAPYTFTVTFTETGLTPGALWKVKIGHKTVKSTSNTITFELGNGTYTFSVKGPHGETPTPLSGPVDVDGSPETEMVTFA